MFTSDNTIEIPAEIRQLLKDSISTDPQVAYAANQLLKAAITSGPLKKGVLFGDIVTGIFSMDKFEPGEPITYPLDIVGAGDVKFHIAYQVSRTGYVPMRTVEGDYMAIKTYPIRTSVDWSREM